MVGMAAATAKRLIATKLAIKHHHRLLEIVRPSEQQDAYGHRRIINPQPFVGHPATRTALQDRVTVLVGYAPLTHHVPAVQTVLADLGAVHAVLLGVREDLAPPEDDVKTDGWWASFPNLFQLKD